MQHDMQNKFPVKTYCFSENLKKGEEVLNITSILRPYNVNFYDY